MFTQVAIILSLVSTVICWTKLPVFLLKFHMKCADCSFIREMLTQVSKGMCYFSFICDVLMLFSMVLNLISIVVCWPKFHSLWRIREGTHFLLTQVSYVICLPKFPKLLVYSSFLCIELLLVASVLTLLCQPFHSLLFSSLFQMHNCVLQLNLIPIIWQEYG